MNKMIYLVKGPNLPTKVAVVAFELEHSTLLDIENRFLTGDKYTTLLPVKLGVISLAEPMFGKHDQAYFPGFDAYEAETADGSRAEETDNQPGRILITEEGVTSPRVAYLVEFTAEGKTENFIVVIDATGNESSKDVVDAFGGLVPTAKIKAQYIGSGSFQAADNVARKGFRVQVGPEIVLNPA